MKSTVVALILLIVSFPCFAQESSNPREHLKQYVADLQKSPDDQALREKIIKLALMLDPKPATPEDAERFMARGQAALEIAKESKDYAQSIAEFQKAALAAPWLGNIYYNLGFVQEKAGDYNAALRNLKLYLLATPNASDEKEVKALIYKIEYKQEQAAKEASPEAAAERARKKEAEFLKSLDGARFVCTTKDDGDVDKQSIVITGDRLVWRIAVVQSSDPREQARVGEWRIIHTGTVTGRDFKEPYGAGTFMAFKISEDGDFLKAQAQNPDGTPAGPMLFFTRQR